MNRERVRLDRRASLAFATGRHDDVEVLDAFLASNRDVVIARARARVAARASPKPSDAELKNGIPVFLDQLVEALRLAKSSSVIDHEQMNKSAARHGQDLLQLGLTVAQVVRDYGDVCQVITELAIEQEANISGDEFRILNLCLDDAIANAVTEYARLREHTITAEGTERLGVLAHEQRNLLYTALLAFESIKTGRVAVGGSTALVLGRSLLGLRDLMDRTLADVRLDAGIGHLERMSVADLVEEIEIDGLIQAEARGLHFTVTLVERAVTIEADRHSLAATLSNMVQNAFKFSRTHGHISLRTSATADRVIFEVEDECGGLPPGKPEELFRVFEQRGHDRSGVGLGLSICLKAAKANGGEMRVRDLPGKGCIFTLDLPRKPPPLEIVSGRKVETNAGAVAHGADAPKIAKPGGRAG